ncbi:MAG: hypothetical protein NVS1B9_11420 [Solirubrobacteraceae bacterium]
MSWLADCDLGAARSFARGLREAASVSEVRERARQGLSALVPADLATWDEVAPDSATMRHDADPRDSEPPGAYAALIGSAADHPLLRAHVAGARPALRLSEAVEPRGLRASGVYHELLRPSGMSYGIAIAVRSARGETLVAGLGRREREFSARDSDVLDLVRPQLEAAWRTAEAREQLDRAMPAGTQPAYAAVLLDAAGEVALSSAEADRWLGEHFGAPEHPGWLPQAVGDWISLPPRPPLESVREGRRLLIQLLPGEPHALLLEEDVASFRPEALRRMGLDARDADLLCAVAGLADEAEVATELFLSMHTLCVRLDRIEARLDVPTAREAVAQALSGSL